MNYTLLFLSILPSVILLWMFLTSDKYPEPPGAVTVAFLLGMLIPVVFYVLSPLFDFAQSLIPVNNPYLSGTLEAFLLAAMPEECLKFAVLYGLCRRFSCFDEPMDGIVYGVTVAVGFATFENLTYVMTGNSYMLAVARGVLAVPSHAMDGAIMGYFVGRAAFTDGRGRNFLAKALFIPMLLHGLYDTPLMIHAYAEAMGVRVAALASRGLNVLFFTVVLRQIGYVAQITGKVRREQEPGPLPQPKAAPGVISAVAEEVAESVVQSEVSENVVQSDVVCVIRNTRTGMDMLLLVLCFLGLFLSLSVPLSGEAGVPGGLSIALPLLFLGGSILFGFRFMVGLIKNLSPLRLRRLRERKPGSPPQPKAAPGVISAVAEEVAESVVQSDVVCVIRNTRTGMDMLLVVLCLLGLFLSLSEPLSGEAGVPGGLSIALPLLFLGGSILFGFRFMVGLIKNLSPLRLRRLRERERGGH